MKKILTIGIALLALGVFAFAPAASAADDGDATVQGRGWLKAKGHGSVDIDMAGWIKLKIDGDLVITDHAGDVAVVVRGADDDRLAQPESGAEIRLDDFTGYVAVRGSGFTIDADGTVGFHAHGKGRATLVGDGVYKTRRGDVTVWDGVVELGGTDVEPVPVDS